MEELKKTIEGAFERRHEITPDNVAPETLQAVEGTLELLDRGEVRVAEKQAGEWKVNEWLKKAVLVSFRVHPNALIRGAETGYYDKVPLKYADYTDRDFQRQGARVVPPATVRHGTYIAPSTVLMPSYCNIGAYIDEGTMVDTWATVGSCAQIGKNVHISGGVGIGGVLEPLQAYPVIVEDDVFLGARSEVAEGVLVEEGAVLSMGVFLGQSTPIYKRETGELIRGRIPARSVVVPGTLPASDGSHSLYCAVIVKQVDAGTRAKTSVNELLRHV